MPSLAGKSACAEGCHRPLVYTSVCDRNPPGFGVRVQGWCDANACAMVCGGRCARCLWRFGPWYSVSTLTTVLCSPIYVPCIRWAE